MASWFETEFLRVAVPSLKVVHGETITRDGLPVEVVSIVRHDLGATVGPMVEEDHKSATIRVQKSLFANPVLGDLLTFDAVEWFVETFSEEAGLYVLHVKRTDADRWFAENVKRG